MMRYSLLIYLVCIQMPSLAISWFTHDRAAISMQKGDFAEAKSKLTALLRDQPDNQELIYDLGVASYKTNDFKQAKAYFKQVSELAATAMPMKEKAHFNWANTAVELKQFPEAIEQYEKVLAISPDNKQAKHNLEKVKEMLKKQQEQENQQQEKQNKDQENKDDKNKSSQSKDQKEQQQQDKQKQEQESSQDQNKSNEGQQKDTADQKQGKQNSADQKEWDQKNKEQQEKSQQQKEQEKQSAQEKEDRAKQENGQKKEGEQEHKQPNEQESQSDSLEQDKSDQKNGQGASTGSEQSEEQQNGGKVKKEKKLEAWLTKVLQDQEKKDASLNKQIIRATVDKKLAGRDGQNCW